MPILDGLCILVYLVHLQAGFWKQTSNSSVSTVFTRADCDMVNPVYSSTHYSVALIVLFADSLNALIPDISTTSWKLLSFLVFIPLSFVPLNILSYTSILGILG